MSAGRFVPKVKGRTCSVCAGPVMRTTNAAAPPGFEDTALPLLHLHAEDWQDNPHDVVLAEPVPEPCVECGEPWSAEHRCLAIARAEAFGKGLPR
jgi:hypothetical protein